MGLKTYIAKRLVNMAVLLFFVLTINFVIFMLMPGDPTLLFVNPMKFAPEEIEAMKKAWGLADPLHVRYIKYIKNMLTMNFGDSIITGRPVAEAIMQKLPYTVFLIGGSTIISMIIGILLGVISAYKRGTRFDDANVTIALIFYSLPTFWMGMVFLMIFSKMLGWFPLAGAFPREWLAYPPKPAFTVNLFGIEIAVPTLYEIYHRLRHTFLPLATLVLFQYGGWLLLTRATMLETLTEDYILTAKAKGLKERTILFRHALKNASLPLITSAALSFGFMLTGAIITETVYTWPGLGGWIWESISSRDYPALQAIFYIIAVCVIVANFIADLIYGFIDPRIKYE